MDKYTNPMPEITRVSEPFYKAAKNRNLLIQRCKDCEKSIFYPKSMCPHCWSENVEWIVSKGKGKLYSYTIVNTGAPDEFAGAVPYVIGVIDLDEGVRMVSWIVECAHDKIKCNMDVEVSFKDLNEEYALPMFRGCCS